LHGKNGLSSCVQPSFYIACGGSRGRNKLGERTEFGLAHFSAAHRGRSEEE
jgi:hypothetical protein